MKLVFCLFLLVLVASHDEQDIEATQGCQDSSDEDLKAAYEEKTEKDAPSELTCQTSANVCGPEYDDTVAEVIRENCPATCGACTGRECYTDRVAGDYRGSVNTTKSGATCQRWTSQYPNSYVRRPEKFRDRGLGYHNYCRNPDNDPGGAWCYTINGERWEYCEIGPECYTDGVAVDYRGSVNTTKSGVKCQSWTAQSPNSHTRTPTNYRDKGLGHHNYCRNPDNDPGGAWCYSTKRGPELRREYCDIGLRSTSC